MCGIAGYIGKNRIDESCILNTLDLMKNRGPDHQGFSEFVLGDLNIFLLHSRLGIIDLDSRSNQPYQFDHLHLVFNGEIYNYIEIRGSLLDCGYRFETDGDTEVLIKAFHCWGNDTFDKLEGMWALAIFDERNGKVLLSRDRFAEKPLFYHDTGEGVVFGSEVKFLKKLLNRNFEINETQIYRYLVNGYKSLYKQNETYYKSVFEIPNASTLRIDSSLQYDWDKYWDPRPKVNPTLSLNDAIEGTRDKLLRAVKLRLRSDVPLAFCLSGGIDSASLASFAAKVFNYDVHSFSIIDSDERYNEYDNIMATIHDIDCNHTLIELNYDHVFDRLKKLISYHDGPISTISYLVHSMLSEQISNHGYRVSISGTAADELFTGYYDHFNLHLSMMRNHQDYEQYLNEWKMHIEPIVRNPHLKDPTLYFNNPSFRSHIYLNNQIFKEQIKAPFDEDFFEFNYTDHLLHNRMLNELFHESTRVILREDDLNSMFYSIENRSPFLDRELFDFAYSIPVDYLIQNGYAKYILREAMHGILNEKVRTDRRKKGFNASIQSLFDFSDKKTIGLFLDDSKVFEMVDKSFIENIISKNEFSNSYSKFLFNFLNTKVFLEES